MSAWVIALGMGAGYLINKNLTLTTRLDESVREFNSAAAPAAPSGPSSAAIRKIQRTVPDAETKLDMNVQHLSPQEITQLQQARQVAADEVKQYEAGPPPIQGVYLTYDRGGV